MSRRKADEVVFASEIKVNGEIVTNPATQIFPGDEVVWRKKAIKPIEEKTYIALHKPIGFTTTFSDRYAEKLITDLLPTDLHHLKYAGRLDRETSGLVLMSNDGEFVYVLTHPSENKEKEYKVTVQKHLTEEQIAQLESGIILDGKKTAPAKVHSVSDKDFYLIITEGRNRQIRRMCEVIKNPVVRLRRVRMGEIELGNLKGGKFRHLTPAEIASVLEN